MSDQDEIDFDEVVKTAKNHSFKKILLNRKRLEYILDDSKFYKILEATQKALMRQYPEHATLDDAAEFVNNLKVFAKKTLKKID